MWSAEPTDLWGEDSPRTNSSPLPCQHFLPCTKQGWCSPRMGNDFVASHRAGGKKGAQGSWSSPIPTTRLGQLGLCLAEPGRAPGMEMPQHPGDLLQSDAEISSCSASPTWTRRMPKAGAACREATVALQVPLQDPPGHDHQTPGGETTHQVCKSCSNQPTSWQESNQRDAWGIS